MTSEEVARARELAERTVDPEADFLQVRLLEAKPNHMFTEDQRAAVRFLHYSHAVACAECGRMSKRHWTSLSSFKAMDGKGSSFILLRSATNKVHPPLTPVCESHPMAAAEMPPLSPRKIKAKSELQAPEDDPSKEVLITEESLECIDCAWVGCESESVEHDTSEGIDYNCPACGSECAHFPLDEIGETVATNISHGWTKRIGPRGRYAPKAPKPSDVEGKQYDV